MPIIFSPISENMRTIRTQKGLTQRQVAEACGMADTTYRTYELGKANPKPATVARIAKALGVSVEEIYGVCWAGGQSPDVSSAVYQSLLLDQGGAIPIDAPHQNHLLMAYSKLNEQGQATAIKRIEEMGQIPAYQSKQSVSIEFTEEDYSSIRGAIRSLEESRLEQKLMGESRALSTSSRMTASTSNALTSARKRENRALKELGEILYRALKRKTDTQASDEG